MDTIDFRYRDASLPVAERVENLLGQMTLEEKAGLFFHTMISMGENGKLAEADTTFGTAGTDDYVEQRHMNHFNLFGLASSGRSMAEWHNRLQEMAANTRLGIPVTVSTDPRHHFSDNPGAAMLAGPFSQWPETLGLGAIGDPALVERFAEIARQEYTAVGLRVALHPQIDLATEARWARQVGTFGENAELTSRLGVAYIRGFQGGKLGAGSVATMTKHFPGGGPQLDGEDPHFAYGREQVYPGGKFEYHLRPFEAAFEAGTSQIMPYYGMPMGTEYEEVGFGFNKSIITGLLRERYAFDGIVCTDWGLISDAEIMGQPFPARAWGVEHLSVEDRMVRVIEAGVDQFGGEEIPEVLTKLVRDGRISEARIDESARRLLREKFVLGLFDNPFVDVDQAEAIVGRADFLAEGEAAQRASITVLAHGGATPALPLRRGIKVYVEGMAVEVAAEYGEVVERPADADVAIIRVATPFEERETFFENYFHAGSLDFPADQVAHLTEIASQVPTVIDVFLDRGAILTPFHKKAALIANFGASANAVMDVLFGVAKPLGRLPIELPSSMEAVQASRPDVPSDTADPLFPFGHGVAL